MEQFKKAKVVMLPTNQKSRLFKGGGSLNYLSHTVDDGEGWRSPQHLYIISDDKIKLFDWIYNNKENIVEQITSKTQLIFVLEENKENQTFKKIIATTDSSLEIFDKELSNRHSVKVNILLPEPSQQFIQKYIEEYNKGNYIEDVLVEYEDGKSYSGNEGLIIKEWLKIDPKDNTITIKKVKDSWSREEVEDLIYSAMKDRCYTTIAEWKKWIEENL